MGVLEIALIAGVVIALAGAAAAAVMASRMKIGSDLKPTPESAFAPTTSNEAIVIPKVFGKCRINPNLLWYGNKDSEEIVSHVSGSNNNPVVGYHYYMDIWLGLCQGPNVRIERVFSDDKEPDYKYQTLGTVDDVSGATLLVSQCSKKADGYFTNGFVEACGQFRKINNHVGSTLTLSSAFDERVATGSIVYVHPSATGDPTSSNYEDIPGIKSLLCHYLIEGEESQHKAVSSGFNPGSSDGFVPTKPGPYTSPLNPIAHIFFERLYIGKDVSAIPSYHFVVECTSDTGIGSENMTTGTNPAAIVYEMLIDMGLVAGDLNFSTFTSASSYWNSKNRALNIQYNSQAELREQLRKVLEQAGGFLRRGTDGRIELKAYRDDETATASVEAKEFKSFRFSRQSYDELPNDFIGTFLDEEESFTERTVRVKNSALRAMVGNEVSISVDLSGYRDKRSASRRLAEIVKQNSYPRGSIEGVLGPKFGSTLIGDLLSVTHEEYGIANELYRVIEKTTPASDSEDYSFKLEQYIEGLFDDNWWVAGGSKWVSRPYVPEIDTRAIFELPLTPFGYVTPAFVALTQRKRAVHTTSLGTWYDEAVSFGVEWSLTEDGTYTQVCQSQAWSEYGLLKEAYSASTYAVDDEDGLLVKLNRTEEVSSADLETGLGSLGTRAELFNLDRLMLVNDELMAYQTATRTSTNPIQYRLTGVIRGLWGTTKASHSVDSPVWLFRLSDNVFSLVPASTFWVRMWFKTAGDNDRKYMAASDGSYAFQINVEAKAKKPLAPGRISVSRSGTSCSVSVWPAAGVWGAGTEAAENQYDAPYPFTDAWNGTLQYYIQPGGSASSPTEISLTYWSYSQSGGHVLYVRSSLEGINSEWTACVVGGNDGAYYGPTQLSPSDLEPIAYNMQGWNSVIKDNMIRLNDELLWLQNLIDVEITGGLIDGNVIKWDAASKKAVNVPYTDIWP